jgi:hypothetical protein
MEAESESTTLLTSAPATGDEPETFHRPPICTTYFPKIHLNLILPSISWFSI